MQRTLSALFAALALATVGCQQQLTLDPALVTGEQAVTSLAVDDGAVYWTRADGTVRKLSLDTGQVSTIGTRAAVPGILPANLVLDDTYLYWFVGSNLVRVPKAGGTPEAHTQPNDIRGLSLDETSLYFTMGDDDGVVMKASKDVASTETLAATLDPKPILAGTANVLWAAGDDKGALLQIPTTGGQADVMRATLGQTLALAQDVDHIYWGTSNNGGNNGGNNVGPNRGNDGTINMMAPDGSNPVVIAGQQATPTGMLSDSVHVYWSNTAGEVHAAPIAGGDEQRIVEGPSTCASNLVGAQVHIAMDATNIYWANGCDDVMTTMPRL